MARPSMQEALAFQRNIPLSRLSTFHIGGDADYLLTPSTPQCVIEALRFLKTEGIRHLILGRGSNLLFDDAGYRGVIVSTAGLTQIQIEGTRVVAQAGVSDNALASAAAKAGLSGMEFLFGIPGSVGGAVYMNAGAYDGEISQILKRVHCFSIEEQREVSFRADECELGYRHSVFHERKWVILSTEFELIPGDTDTIQAKMEELMRRRAEKQPLNYPSAGSTFKRYPGKYTAQMIDQAGLKGASVGGAQVSEKHAGFLINRGGATCEDMRALIRLVKERVYEVHGVKIECEVEYIPAQASEEGLVWN